MSQQKTAYLNLSMAMVIVGSSVVFGKIITHSFPVFLASGLRFAIASAAMVPVLYKSRNKLKSIRIKEWSKIVIMAFCGQFVFTFLLLLGLRYTSGIETGIITSTSCGVMAAMSRLLFLEKTTRRQMAGIILVVGGVMIINGLPLLTGESFQGFHLLGNMLILGAVSGEAVFLLMRKRISSKISDMELTGLLCMSGFVMFMPFAAWQSMSFDLAAVSLNAWISLLYFGAVFTVLAYLFWFKGVKAVKGNVAGAFTAVMPVSAALFSMVFLKESLTFAHLSGGLLILSAIFLMCSGAKT